MCITLLINANGIPVADVFHLHANRIKAIASSQFLGGLWRMSE
jgi:hypothetical protein